MRPTAVSYTHLDVYKRQNECWCVLVFRDIHEEYLQEQQMNLEISQLATAARIAYQMLIADVYKRQVLLLPGP